MKKHLISKYRTELMGLSIVWIYIFHSRGHIIFPDALIFRLLEYLADIGNGGVDIFIFLSGYGLTCGSYKKDFSAVPFYKRRFLRIFPGYLIATGISLLILGVFGHEVNIMSAILKLSTLWFWAGNGLFLWFIPVIIGMYLIFPFFINLFRKSDDKLFFTICSMLFFYSLCGILSMCEKSYYLIFLTRVPVFFLGIFICNQHITNAKSNKSPLLFHTLLTCIGFIIIALIRTNVSYNTQVLTGLRFYPFILSTFPLLCIVSNCLCWLDRHKKLIFKIIISTLSFLGDHSLEIYLLHEHIVFPIGAAFLNKRIVTLCFFDVLNYGNFFEYFIYFLITVFLAWILKMICNCILDIKKVISRGLVEAHR